MAGRSRNVHIFWHILIFQCLFEICFSFKDIHLGNKTYPGWHHYKYFEKIEDIEMSRSYVMTEIEPRAFLMCPKGFAIDRLTSQLYYFGKNNSEPYWSEPYVYDWKPVFQGLNYEFSNNNEWQQLASLPNLLLQNNKE